MKPDTLKWIKENKVIPINLINKLKEIPEELLNKIKHYEKVLSENNVIITGNDSIYKDLTAVYLLMKCADTKRRRIIYYSYPDVNIKPAYLTAIMRLEIIKDTYKINKVSEILIGMVTKGYKFVISCDSIESLDDIFGDSKSKILIENSVEFPLPEIEHNITVLGDI